MSTAVYNYGINLPVSKNNNVILKSNDFDAPMFDLISPAKDVIKSITNLMNKAVNVSTFDSDEAFARMLQEEEFELAYGKKSTSLAELKNTVKQAEDNYYSVMTQSDEAIARMLQEDEYARIAQEESDLAYALQLSYDLNDWA